MVTQLRSAVVGLDVFPNSLADHSHSRVNRIDQLTWVWRQLER